MARLAVVTAVPDGRMASSAPRNSMSSRDRADATIIQMSRSGQPNSAHRSEVKPLLSKGETERRRKMENIEKSVASMAHKSVRKVQVGGAENFLLGRT